MKTTAYRVYKELLETGSPNPKSKKPPSALDMTKNNEKKPIRLTEKTFLHSTYIPVACENEESLTAKNHLGHIIKDGSCYSRYNKNYRVDCHIHTLASFLSIRVRGDMPAFLMSIRFKIKQKIGISSNLRLPRGPSCSSAFLKHMHNGIDNPASASAPPVAAFLPGCVLAARHSPCRWTCEYNRPDVVGWADIFGKPPMASYPLEREVPPLKTKSSPKGAAKLSLIARTTRISFSGK